MRGGLDDALERLARRDRLRRRSAQQAGGTPPEVTELVEAVAAVVARHPDLAVTIGVEGAGAPVLLHLENEDGVVRVDADDALSGPASRRTGTVPLAADAEISFDLEGEARPINVAAESPPAAAAAAAWTPANDTVPTGPGADTVPTGPGADTARVEPTSRRRSHPAAYRLPEGRPVPFRVQPEETQQAAKRLAAMLREDPSLLHPTPPD